MGIRARSLSQPTKYTVCPICRKPDWCLISEDGNACICARTQSDQPAGKAGWLHKIGSDYQLPIEPKKSPAVKQLSLASLR